MIKKAQKEVKYKKIVLPSKIAFIIFAVLVGARFVYHGFGSIFPILYINEIYSVINWITGVVLIILFIFVIKYPRFIESFTTYFNIKSVYLIKNSGVLIYYKNFKKTNDAVDLMYSDEFVMAGFINTLSSGLKKVINIDGKINSICVGNHDLLFTYGDEVIGVLLVSKGNKKLSNRLIEFVNEFERIYKNQLVRWNGDVSIFKQPGSDLKKLIFKLFI
jgi:hypothetical protein